MRILHCSLQGETGHEAGRRLLAELYRQETGEDLPPILKTPRGKPYFADSPWHFSISHTKNNAFCVLAQENVAIDAEELSRRARLRHADKMLSPSEYAQFLAAEDQNRAFLTFWILKEAAAKLSGEGLTGAPSHTAFSLDDPRVREIGGCLVAVMTE